VVAWSPRGLDFVPSDLAMTVTVTLTVCLTDGTCARQVWLAKPNEPHGIRLLAVETGIQIFAKS
jgi:hypothetical protein